MHSTHQDQYVGSGSDLVFYDQPYDTEQLSSITNVRLWAPIGSPIDRLPKIITAMTGLKALRLVSGWVLPSVITQLRQGDLPESLEELSVNISERTLVWPDVVVPKLQTLYVGEPFRFKNENFPELRALSLYPQRSLNNVRQALELPLEELNLLNVPIGEEVFRLLEPAGLRRLGLLGGRTLTSVTGIGVLPQLESLRWKNLSALGDISELAALHQLEILDIQYCKKITGITALNDLPRLREVTLVGCGNIGLNRIEAKLSTLERADTGATT
ncbi:leucine-rich repeat domain-containing protein [Leucobacter insecticola]|uniref:Leucine-rich repeat domain-containing protein n=1 Tax=Leucobacter insecticola TaxID=2714934 RepID=A0A6G8FFM2_9MICO|nr:leucine-rich repeat domain-containing protein [Leucobacter insecticola]QIM15200.1 leucine-rich repeat domain-containing protein [Leucobacter insecticola]